MVMKFLGCVILSMISGYSVQKLTYEKTLVFETRWGNIIRYTIGVLGAFPLVLLFYKLFSKMEGIERVSLAYLIAYPMFGAGVVAANITDHPDLRNRRKEDKINE
jgi:hypothetical protein